MIAHRDEATMACVERNDSKNEKSVRVLFTACSCPSFACPRGRGTSVDRQKSILVLPSKFAC